MFTTGILALLLASAPLAPAPAAEAAPTAAPIQAEPIEAADLRLALRDLWTNHIFWVRSYVLAQHYEDAAAAEAAEAQAVENARALANGIEPFYGQEAADQLFGLLAGHYGAIKDYMSATYDGQPAGQEAASRALSANAEAIADFLDGANPNLPKEAVLPLLVAHGGHHMQQIRAFDRGDFAAEAEVWKAMLEHVYGIADAMAEALGAQFPDLVTAG